MERIQAIRLFLRVVALSCDDRYVNLVEQGVDLAVRMGRLAYSTLGSRYLGRNRGSGRARMSASVGPAQRTARPAAPQRPHLQHGAGRQIHAVYPSPRMVPAKVTQLIEWLQGQFADDWWARAAVPHAESRRAAAEAGRPATGASSP